MPGCFVVSGKLSVTWEATSKASENAITIPPTMLNIPRLGEVKDCLYRHPMVGKLRPLGCVPMGCPGFHILIGLVVLL